MASPTPVFMPSPPVGITRCAASPAMKTRRSPYPVASRSRCVQRPMWIVSYCTGAPTIVSNIAGMSASSPTTECTVK